MVQSSEEEESQESSHDPFSFMDGNLTKKLRARPQPPSTLASTRTRRRVQKENQGIDLPGGLPTGSLLSKTL